MVVKKSENIIKADVERYHNIKKMRSSLYCKGHTVQQLFRMNLVQRMSDNDKRNLFRLLGVKNFRCTV